jgi:hypothetical protein
MVYEPSSAKLSNFVKYLASGRTFRPVEGLNAERKMKFDMRVRKKNFVKTRLLKRPFRNMFKPIRVGAVQITLAKVLEPT